MFMVSNRLSQCMCSVAYRIRWYHSIENKIKYFFVDHVVLSPDMTLLLYCQLNYKFLQSIFFKFSTIIDVREWGFDEICRLTFSII